MCVCACFILKFFGVMIGGRPRKREVCGRVGLLTWVLAAVLALVKTK